MTGLLINRIGKFPILRKFILNRRFSITFQKCFFIFEIVFVLTGTGCCGIGCMLTDIPVLQTWFFIILMTVSLCANILNAATVEIYPTASR